MLTVKNFTIKFQLVPEQPTSAIIIHHTPAKYFNIEVVMIFPIKLTEIQALIDDEVQESLHLDYKEARAVGKTSKQKSDFAKDVSSFANSDGGVLIYGVKEKGHLPISITGIDHSQFSREFIEQTIRTNISPPSPNFTIVQIPINQNESVYSIKVEKSFGTPHQCKDNKIFYKRHNFESVPMESYEIDDVRNRLQTVPSLVNISAKLEPVLSVFLEIKNIGNQVARDVSFEYSEDLEFWVKEQKAKIFNIGIKYFPPQQKYRFRYGFINSIFHESSKIPAQFEISVSYNHPLYSERITESFGIDLLSYFGSYAEKSDTIQQSEKIEKELKEITREVKKLNENLSTIAKIAGSTGLDLSISTLRNLRNLLEKKPFGKIDPTSLSYLSIKEILEVDWHLASNLEHFFWQGNEANGLKNVEGITDDVIKKIKEYFILEGDVT